METLCRICIENEAKCTSINSKIEKSSNIMFLDFLNKCTTLNAREGDSLPQSLCSVCANTMRTFYSFMKLAEKSDLILREALKKLVGEGRYNGHGDIPCEEIPIKNEKIEENSFHWQPSENSTGSSLYILDIVKEEPRVSESTSTVAVKGGEIVNSESNLIYPESSNKEPDDVLSRRLASISTEHTDAEEDVPISLLKSRLPKIEGEADSESNSTSLLFEQQCEEIKIRNETIGHGCKICGKVFSAKHNLKVHLGNHNGIIQKCHKCGKEFKHINTLRRHLRWHTNPKPFKCENCEKSLSSKESYTRHMDICQPQQMEKPKIECSICGKNFSRKDYLDVHMENHMGITTRCDQCGKEFEHRYSLSRHMRWHINPRPFNCEHCGKSFIRKYRCTRHMEACKSVGKQEQLNS